MFEKYKLIKKPIGFEYILEDQQVFMVYPHWYPGYVIVAVNNSTFVFLGSDLEQMVKDAVDKSKNLPGPYAGTHNEIIGKKDV